MASAGDASANAFWANVALQMQLMTLNLHGDIMKFQTATESICRLQKVIRAHNKMLRAENEVLQNRVDRLRRHHALHQRTLSGMQPPEMQGAPMWEGVAPGYPAARSQGALQQGITRQDARIADAALGQILSDLLGGVPPPQPPQLTPPPPAAVTAAAAWGASPAEGRLAGHPCPAGGTGETLSDFADEVLGCITDLCRAQIGNTARQHQEHLLTRLMHLVDNMPSPEMQQGFGPPPEESLPLPRFGGATVASYTW
eukprot:CAMPEP_0179069052 /NCGR_PEP_ID=MMETSP0796-20121207/30311_1 /TAXON_ID=73915 /ORGANISM="Pyrodinium bahamense, Strain pbaha01" /LENGTH=255 /DNA_ID=CAMNT_0020766111 /DNA_START=148 /DNA_END=915 /DNA_ORIENTATION=+